MSGTILVPLDGSALAEEGLQAACRVARETKASLLLATAVPFSAAAGSTERAQERIALADAKQHLRYHQQMLAQYELQARTTVLPGSPEQAILFLAESEDVDLICMGTHGRNGLRHILLGSVAAAVLRGARAPILLNRAAEPPSPIKTAPYGRLLIALDGTETANTALDFVTAQRLGRAGEVVLVRVVEQEQVWPLPTGTQADQARIYQDTAEHTRRSILEAEEYLSTVSATRLAGWKCEAKVVVDHPVQGILKAIRDTHADLVVLASHDRHGVDRLLHGSMAQAVLKHASVPVLLLHGGAGASAAPESAGG
jgi:nucleotide-binding universal stress UspA family protein